MTNRMLFLELVRRADIAILNLRDHVCDLTPEESDSDKLWKDLTNDAFSNRVECEVVCRRGLGDTFDDKLTKVIGNEKAIMVLVDERKMPPSSNG